MFGNILFESALADSRGALAVLELFCLSVCFHFLRSFPRSPEKFIWSFLENCYRFWALFGREMSAVI